MVKLDRLINVLGGYGARLECAPRGRDVELRGVALHDSAGTDEVLLAVGVEPGAIGELLRTTMAAVVLLREVAGPELVVARERGVAVVLVDGDVLWGQLAAVVYGLVLEGRETEAGRGPTDLFALADALAASVGGPVTIEDRHSGVLAYSSRQESADRARLATILGRRVPAEIRAELASRGVYAHLASSDEPFFAEPMPEFHGRALVAVRAGRELLGSIWVEVPEPLSPERAAALREGARTASLHLLRARASADLERQVESDLVIGLLEGQADAPAVLSRLGLRGTGFQVVAVQAEEAQDAAVLIAFERATSGFGWARPGRSALFANTVYTVLPEAEPGERWFRRLLREMPAEVRLRAGVGGAAEPLELPVSRREADESLAVVGSREIVGYDDAWHEILLRRLRNAASGGRLPARGPVRQLHRHDAEHGTRYAATLREWLRCQGDPGAAARRLGVHANTVRYRMRKMTEVAPIDVTDPDQRLALIVALLIE